MTEGISRQLRVLHVVSSGGIAEAMQPSLFMPLATKLPKQRVKVQVVSLSPGCVRAAVLRQHGVPVHDVPFSRARFAMHGFRDLMNAVHAFRPDVIQAWGHTAQLVSITARKRCDWSPAVIWSVVDTAPLAKEAGFVDRHKLKMVANAAARADRIVYTSEAGAAHHRRAGFPEAGHACISPGVDAVRFKPDATAGAKVRERLQVPHDAFVIGMVAPFQPEYDHATFLKGVAELIKTNPNIYVLLAGHGVQRGNAPLIAMIGSGALASRIQLLGEWSDLTSLFNACDLVCSSALTDSARMTLAMAMLCGIPCVATGLGAQGELIGQHGVAIEPGNPAAFVRGIGKILQMPEDKRHQLAHGARKYALQSCVYVRSLQKYMQLYSELAGKEALAQAVTHVPEVEVSAPAVKVEAPRRKVEATPQKVEAARRRVEAPPPPKKPAIAIEQLADPDSLEARVTAAEPESLPKWRIEQEQARAEQDARWSSNASSDGDVLQMFELELAAKPATAAVTPMSERARGFVEDFEELLPVEALTAPVTQSSAIDVSATPLGASGAAPTLEPARETRVASEVPLVIESATEESRSRSEEVLVSAVPVEITGTKPAEPEHNADQCVSVENARAENHTEQPDDTVAATQVPASDTSALEASATLPPIKTLAALEAAASNPPEPEPATASDASPEPIQVSLFDFELTPEPEKKALSG